MSKEKVFIVDEDNVPQESQSRDIMIQNDLWCRVASIIVVDKEKDAILCHKRSENKDQRPGLWVAEFGGKSNPDEDSIVTAQRELFEESGIECLPEELIFTGLHKSTDRKQFAYCYYLPRPEATKVSLDPNEVTEVKWYGIEQAIENLKNNRQWYSYGSDLELLNQLSQAK